MNNYLTKGKNYQIVRENENNFVIVCDNNQEVGFDKSRFVPEMDFYLDVEQYKLSQEC
jgi:hypothetical protein